MCSGQTPSLNLTSRTCSKNHINWYKPCRFLHLRALNVDEEGERGRADRAVRRDVMRGIMEFKCIHFKVMCHLQNICLSQFGTIHSSSHRLLHITCIGITQTVPLQWWEKSSQMQLFAWTWTFILLWQWDAEKSTKWTLS